MNHESKRAEFEATALPWLDALYRFAIRLTRDATDADDLVQETFLRAYRTFENFEPGTNGRAWLFTILYSIFINQQRRLGRQGLAVSVEALDEEDVVEASAKPADASDAIVFGSLPGFAVGPEVTRALSDLPADFRAAILLVDAEELTYEEAAAVLGCPLGTVRSRLFRARRQLAQTLREYAARQGFARGVE